jgi:hypothetical protein
MPDRPGFVRISVTDHEHKPLPPKWGSIRRLGFRRSKNDVDLRATEYFDRLERFAVVDQVESNDKPQRPETSVRGVIAGSSRKSTLTNLGI